MFKKLEYVYAVYKEKSFTKAAEKLFISQPSLSAAIKNIELEIGAPIFDRSRGVTLTEIGQEYIRAAEQMMNIQQNFVNRVNDIYNLDAGRIIVGGTNYLSSYVLPHIITQFSKLYPNIEVTLVEENSRTLEEMIRKEEIDIAIDSFMKTPDDYIGYPLTDEKVLLCVPNSLEINKQLTEHAISPDGIYTGAQNPAAVKAVPLSIFKDENFILLKNGNDMHTRAMHIFEKANIAPPVSFSVDQLNISYFLAESGMGLCFATDTLFRFGQFRNNVTLYNIGDDFTTRTLYIAHKKNKYCTCAMKRFIEISKEVVHDIKPL